MSGGCGRYECSDALPPYDQPLMLQLAERLHHRIRIDRQRVDNLFHAGQLITWLQPAQHHIPAHLLDQLPVDRDTGPRGQW
jgi:hypothetical protein